MSSLVTVEIVGHVIVMAEWTIGDQSLLHEGFV